MRETEIEKAIKTNVDSDNKNQKENTPPNLHHSSYFSNPEIHANESAFKASYKYPRYLCLTFGRDIRILLAYPLSVTCRFNWIVKFDRSVPTNPWFASDFRLLLRMRILQ